MSVGAGRSPWAAALAAAVVAAVLVTAPAEPAEAGHVSAARMISRYVNTADWEFHRGLGCNRALGKLFAGGTGTLFLIYGQPKKRGNEYGVSLYSNSFASTKDIKNAALGLASGIFLCSFFAPINIRIVPTTTNFQGETSYDHGRAWARMITELNAELAEAGLTRYASAAGGNDMELDWNSPSATISWVNGWEDNNKYALYDAGDAGGCPQSGTAYGRDGACNNGWRQSHVHWKAIPGSRQAFPQIYNTGGAQARQWQQINLWHYMHIDSRGNAYFGGVLTQSNACAETGGCPGTDNTPDAAVHQLYSALASDQRTVQCLCYLENTSDMSWHK